MLKELINYLNNNFYCSESFLNQFACIQNILTQSSDMILKSPIHIVGLSGTGKTKLLKLISKFTKNNGVYLDYKIIDDFNIIISKIKKFIDAIDQSNSVNIICIDNINSLEKYKSILNIIQIIKMVTHSLYTD